MALSFVWAAAPDWPAEGEGRRLDGVGAGLFTTALASGLVALSTLGQPEPGVIVPISSVAAVIFIVTTALTVRHLRRTKDPFLETALLRNRIFSGALLVSLLTGYALATAILGAAVYVDRVRYGGPEEQRVVLGSLALAMTIGALASGFLLRYVRIVPLSLFGLVLAILGMVLLGTSSESTPLPMVLLGLALFGLGFGLTVTPRSTAAVEALGRRAFGVASAGVTVARMTGMAVGLAVLTGFGTQRIEGLSVVLTDDAARDAVLPATLQGRPISDPLVWSALEHWASGQAASILASLFLVAALFLVLAIFPTLLMNGAPSDGGRATIAPDGHPTGFDADDGSRPAPAF